MTTTVRKQLRNFFISNLAVAVAAAAAAASHMHDGMAWHGQACVFSVSESSALDFWRQVLRRRGRERKRKEYLSLSLSLSLSL